MHRTDAPYDSFHHDSSLLKDGAICIGETHSDSGARKKLLALIDSGNVKKIFLEIPACSKEVQEFLADPNNALNSHDSTAMNNYITNMKNNTPNDNKEISWTNIILHARKNGIAVYCDDLPVLESCSKANPRELSYTFEIPEDSYTINPNKYFNKLYLELTTSSSHPHKLRANLEQARGKESGVKIRNQYSADIVKIHTSNFSAEAMKGVIVYGGTDHFNVKYAENSLQQLCNIPPERVLDYSPVVNKTKRRAVNDANVNTLAANSNLTTQSIYSQAKKQPVSAEVNKDKINDKKTYVTPQIKQKKNLS